MLQIRQMPTGLYSIEAMQAYVQDAVLVSSRGVMVVHPHQTALFVRGESAIEMHTVFGTVHYLNYDAPAQLGADWRNLTAYMDQNQPGTMCHVWKHQDIHGKEYYLHVHIPSLVRVSSGVHDANALIPTMLVIEANEYALQLELDAGTCDGLLDELNSAIRFCWAI